MEYAEAQAHADQVDAWLGFRIPEAERALRQSPVPAGARLWEDLPPRTFQTPYTELRQILERLRPRAGDTIVDLGAGYARLAFVLARHYPGAFFLGYEISSVRVNEARRVLALHHHTHARLELADLGSPEVQLPWARAYFLYDFGARPAVARVLQELSRLARQRPIAVVARGRLSRDLIEREEPWLSQVVPPEAYAHWSLYRSARAEGEEA